MRKKLILLAIVIATSSFVACSYNHVEPTSFDATTLKKPFVEVELISTPQEDFVLVDNIIIVN